MLPSMSTVTNQPAAILYYDYALTLSAEIKHFWPPANRVGWPSFIFFLNRYAALFGHIPIVFEIFMYPRNQKVRRFRSRTLGISLSNPSVPSSIRKLPIDLAVSPLLYIYITSSEPQYAVVLASNHSTSITL